MLATFDKYRQAFLTGLQSNIVYRINFTVRGFFSLFHLAAVVILWSAASTGGAGFGGFSLAQTITYFVTLLILQFFISAFNEDYQISEEIRNGLINQFLLKPINYFAYRFSIFVAARLVSGLMVFIPLLIALPVLKDYLAYPTDLGRVLAFGLPAMAMSAVIQFSIAYCFGLLSFWFLEIQGFVILSMALETLLGGQMFPLDLLPGWAYSIAKCLPFYYQMYFPAAIFTGRLTDATLIFQGYAIQAGWVVALLLVNQVLWVRGLREHTAVGG
ncbi:MAG: ABC-2 family transporter protein [Verrucomicrobia bacterium]|nr:ABC-2 family transporter protein [Verrucomicrobiota bacterium]